MKKIPRTQRIIKLNKQVISSLGNRGGHVFTQNINMTLGIPGIGNGKCADTGMYCNTNWQTCYSCPDQTCQLHCNDNTGICASKLNQAFCDPTAGGFDGDVFNEDDTFTLSQTGCNSQIAGWTNHAC